MPDPRPMSARQLRSIIAKIERHKAAIGKHRDVLRKIYEDLETIEAG